jgi:hypothetical protein
MRKLNGGKLITSCQSLDVLGAQKRNAIKIREDEEGR